MYYARIKTTTHDSQEQIDYCLECKKPDCTNCIVHNRVGQLPGRDPCIRCFSRKYCKTGMCKQKINFEFLVKYNPSTLDADWITPNYIKERLKKGDVIFVASSRGRVPREVLKVNKTSFRTEDDLYYFYEHRKLWWFSGKEARRNVS